MTARAVRRGELSASQRSMWLLARLGASGAYNNLLSLILRGPVRRPDLELALQAVIARHEALRTRFTADSDSVTQEVLHESRVVLDDLSAPGREPGPIPVQQALSLAGDWSRAPFDLDAGPLIRASLTPVDGSGHLLVIAAHHLVSDGDSMTIILRELLAIYEARVSDAPDPLPPAPAQFLDVIEESRSQDREPGK